jgi:hypoxanthine phosphoribosyltransferase
VDQKIAVVTQNPVGLLVAFDAEGQFAALLQAHADLIADGLDVALVGPRADHEMIGERGDAGQIENADISGFLRFGGAYGKQPGGDFGRLRFSWLAARIGLGQNWLLTVSYYNMAFFPLSTLRTLISEAQIQARVREMGAEIGHDYAEGDLHLICILKGACFFLADLARAIPRDTFVDFMGISSYGRSTRSSGEVKVTKDLDISVEGADLLIVEDIVDSGVTLNYLLHVLAQRKPRSIRIAALLDKPDRRQRPVEVAYAGFHIPDKFVVGYGLDYAEHYRTLRDICVLEGDGAGS